MSDKSELDWVTDCHESPMYAAEHIVKLEAKVEALEAKLKGTVTTAYHDKIVAEAMQLVALERAKVEALEEQLAEAEAKIYVSETPAGGE